MAEIGATPPLDPALGKDGCPCFADLHHHDLRPGEPHEGQLDEARITKVTRFSARLSKFSASRLRFRPNQEKVCSTTSGAAARQKPFISSLRLTISARNGGTFATATSTCPAL